MNELVVPCIFLGEAYAVQDVVENLLSAVQLLRLVPLGNLSTTDSGKHS